MNVGVICLDTRGNYITMFRHNQLAPIVAGFGEQKFKFILGSRSVEEFKLVYPEYASMIFPWKRSVGIKDIGDVAKGANLNLIVVGGYSTFKAFMPICDKLVILRSLDNRDGQLIDNLELFNWTINSIEGVVQENDEGKMWRVSHLTRKRPGIIPPQRKGAVR